MGKAIATVASIVLGLFVIVYGAFAIYEGSWSLTQHTVQHQLEIQKQVTDGQGKIAEGSFNYQSGLGEQISTGVDNVNTDSTNIVSATQQGDKAYAQSLKDQRAYDASKVCELSTQVNGTLPAANIDTQWITTNCDGPNLKPSSIYYVS